MWFRSAQKCTEVQKKPRRASTDVFSDLEHLDALMRSIYGCTLDEYSSRLCFRIFSDGHQKGYKEGYSAGRRSAKGLKTAKAHGRPLEINRGLRVLMQSEIDGRMRGTPVDQVIKKFLQEMRVGRRLLERPTSFHLQRKLRQLIIAIEKGKYRFRVSKSKGTSFEIHSSLIDGHLDSHGC